MERWGLDHAKKQIDDTHTRSKTLLGGHEPAVEEIINGLVSRTPAVETPNEQTRNIHVDSGP